MMLIESLLTFSHHLLFIAFGISGIGFLIGFHELGHFLFCKIFHIATPSFSIGFGPKLISKKIGETEFSLSLLPLGGYVEIAGAAEVGQGDQQQAYSRDSHSFATKPFYQKLLVMLGGIAFNLLFAYTAITCLFLNNPSSPLLFPLNIRPIIETFTQGSIAEKSGLQTGDLIYAIQGTPIGENTYMLLNTIQQRPNLPTDITIKRNHETITLSVTPDATQIPNTQKIVGTLGITNYQPVSECSIIESIRRGIALTNYYIIGTAQGLIQMITQRNIKGLGGPLMIISLSSKKAAEGVREFFILLSIISINLAVLNLIPLPIFDGGQILFYSIEAIIGRSLSHTVREYIHIATWLLVLLLIIFLSLRDIAHIASPYIETFLQFFGLRA